MLLSIDLGEDFQESLRDVAFDHDSLKYVGKGRVVRTFDQYDLKSAAAIVQIVKKFRPRAVEVYALTTVNSNNFSTFIDEISKELDQWKPSIGTNP